MDVTDTEEWRPIPGYEGRYEVSSHGRVRSLGFYSGNRWGTKTWRAGRMLKIYTIQGHGYRGVTLTDADGVQTPERVHRLVLRAFVGEPPPGQPNGLHKDDDPANNYVGNLRWGTHTENTYDSVENGNHVQTRKKTCELGHLLVEPNLVPSSTEAGGRDCLACKRTESSHAADARLRRQGRVRTRVNRGADGFMRLLGESYEDEAHRRYTRIMRDQLVR